MALNELHRAHTLIFSCNCHVVFCPKYRRKVLVPPIDRRVKELILEKQTQYSYTVVEIEVMPDHVHLLLDVGPRIEIDRVVRMIKGYTAYRSSGISVDETQDAVVVDALAFHRVSWFRFSPNRQTIH